MVYRFLLCPRLLGSFLPSASLLAKAPSEEVEPGTDSMESVQILYLHHCFFENFEYTRSLNCLSSSVTSARMDQMVRRSQKLDCCCLLIGLFTLGSAEAWLSSRQTRVELIARCIQPYLSDQLYYGFVRSLSFNYWKSRGRPCSQPQRVFVSPSQSASHSVSQLCLIDLPADRLITSCSQILQCLSFHLFVYAGCPVWVLLSSEQIKTRLQSEQGSDLKQWIIVFLLCAFETQERSPVRLRSFSRESISRVTKDSS